MEITEIILNRIEEIFKIKFYYEQREYLLLPKGSIHYWQGGRRSGKTLVYCIKLALSEGDTLDFTKCPYTDEYHGDNYEHWFKGFFYDIWKTLKDNGFTVRDAKFK